MHECTWGHTFRICKSIKLHPPRAVHQPCPWVGCSNGHFRHTVRAQLGWDRVTCPGRLGCNVPCSLTFFSNTELRVRISSEFVNSVKGVRLEDYKLLVSFDHFCKRSNNSSKNVPFFSVQEVCEGLDFCLDQAPKVIFYFSRKIFQTSIQATFAFTGSSQVRELSHRRYRKQSNHRISLPT